MMPFAYVDSDLWCVFCSKRMIMEHGQHEESGELVEFHWCLACERGYNVRPERRSLDAPGSQPRRLWITLEQAVEFRTRHLDRPEIRERLGLVP